MPQPNDSLRAEIQELTVEVAVLKSRLEAESATITAQAKEYERRLEELNHLHKSASEDRAQYVTRELHDQLYVELNGKIDTLKTEIDTGRGRSLAVAAIFAGFIAISGLLMTAYHVFLEGAK